MQKLLVFVILLTGCGLTVTEENDYFAGSKTNKDKNYTQGLRIQKGSYYVGQQFYTPEDITEPDPQPNQRPWAGLVYIGGEKVRKGENVSSVSRWTVGCAGPCAGAEQTQKFVHNKLGLGTDPKGWHNQISNRATFQTDKKWQKLLIATDPDAYSRFALSADFTSSVGNVITASGVGLRARLGRFSLRDFGPEVLYPTRRGGDYALYVLGEIRAKTVAYNLFLDAGEGVSKKHFIPEGMVGVGFEFGSICAAYLYTLRGQEFSGDDSSHAFGSIQIGTCDGR